MDKELLDSILEYSQYTGDFIWLVDRSIGRKRGKIAGTKMKSGHIAINYLGKRYYAHRLAFLHMTGRWPLKGIDHIDGNPSNNKWENLRECNQSQNMGNSPKRINNKSGYKGVVFSKGKWVACIKINYEPIRLGLFNSPEEAALAYNEAAIKYFGEFAKLNEGIDSDQDSCRK